MDSTKMKQWKKYRGKRVRVRYIRRNTYGLREHPAESEGKLIAVGMKHLNLELGPNRNYMHLHMKDILDVRPAPMEKPKHGRR